jgi:hypothetical protein
MMYDDVYSLEDLLEGSLKFSEEYSKDSLKEDSLEEDSLEEDSLEEDSLEEDSLEEDSLEEDSLEDMQCTWWGHCISLNGMIKNWVKVVKVV